MEMDIKRKLSLKLERFKLGAVNWKNKEEITFCWGYVRIRFHGGKRIEHEDVDEGRERLPHRDIPLI